MPTPASAASADLHSQHVTADLPVKEVKTETHHDKLEFEAAGGKTEPKMEVGLSYIFPTYQAFRDDSFTSEYFTLNRTHKEWVL